MKDGSKIGCLIGYNLTADGHEYVENAIREAREDGTGGVALEVWNEEWEVDAYDEEVDSLCENRFDGFTELMNDDRGVMFISKKGYETHETKSRYTYLVVRIEYTDQWGDNDNYPAYHISIIGVTPGIIGKKERASMLDSMGLTEDIWNDCDIHAKCHIAIDYGNYATLWQSNGWRAEKLIDAAKIELIGINCLLGFYLDKAQNAIGTSGWDRMRGKF